MRIMPIDLSCISEKTTIPDIIVLFWLNSYIVYAHRRNYILVQFFSLHIRKILHPLGYFNFDVTLMTLLIIKTTEFSGTPFVTRRKMWTLRAYSKTQQANSKTIISVLLWTVGLSVLLQMLCGISVVKVMSQFGNEKVTHPSHKSK